MKKEEILKELEALARPAVRKAYTKRGLKLFFGTPTTKMKALKRKVGLNQPLADELYATGNFDAMYFAGMIAEPLKMSAEDFERWMASTHHYLESTWIVGITLAESPLATEIIRRWADDDNMLKQQAAWAAATALLGWKSDREIDHTLVDELMLKAGERYKDDRLAADIESFMAAVAISFTPRHQEAKALAEQWGMNQATRHIAKAELACRIGFKRRGVRC